MHRIKSGDNSKLDNRDSQSLNSLDRQSGNYTGFSNYVNDEARNR